MRKAIRTQPAGSVDRVQSIEDLWAAAKLLPTRARPSIVETSILPLGVQRYLNRAIGPGAPPASSVRLQMHGEIKLAGWHRFTADQVISWNVGMIWKASVHMYGITVSGSDQLLDGQGAMRWKLFGAVPLMHATGPDITRSSAGRMNIESIWLPSVLAEREVDWSHIGSNSVGACFTANSENAALEYDINDSGELNSVSMARWGNPGGGSYRFVPFGAVVEESATFEGYTIPTRLRVGWFFGTDRFASEGEFFRVTIDSAQYV